MQIISRKEAKAQSLKHYFTGKPCKHGHISKRDINGSCYECKLAHERNNPRNSCARKSYMKLYFKSYEYKNRNEVNRRYYANHAESERERSKLKRLNNNDYYKAKCAERRAVQKNAKPKWYNAKQVSKIYEMASIYGFEVDHIVPLQSELVCGLHTWDNLKLLSRSENASKLNTRWPDMPE